MCQYLVNYMRQPDTIIHRKLCMIVSGGLMKVIKERNVSSCPIHAFRHIG